MKICFVLPGFTRTPIGGHKIIYEYANRLCDKNYEITLIFMNRKKMKQYNIPEKFRKLLLAIVTRYEPNWFILNKGIIKKSGESVNYHEYDNYFDYVFATGIQTVEVVDKYFDNAKKLYFIQGYENWGVTEEYLHKTYSLGFTNIVVSQWLKDVVDKYAITPAKLIKNPIDTSIYKMKVQQKYRIEHSIGLLYNIEPFKGVKYALEAIYILKKQFSDLTVQMFGIFDKPNNLPLWINYKQNATVEDLVKIYNGVEIFMCASIEEGYGLTGLEAMACGACLVSTSYKGVFEYAKDGYNALLSPIEDVDKLVENVRSLFESIELREKLSSNGVESVKQYSWKYAVDKMMDCLNEGCKI